MNHPCKIAFNQKLLCKFKKCVHFQAALKQILCDKITYNEACLCGKIWLWQVNLGFCSFNPKADDSGGLETWHLLATSFDVM
jgi:hypothetical protein